MCHISNMWNEQGSKHTKKVASSFTHLSFWEETHRSISAEGRNYKESYYGSSETLQALNNANKQLKTQKHMKQPTQVVEFYYPFEMLRTKKSYSLC